MHTAYIDRLVDLLDPTANLIWNMPLAEAVARVGSGDPLQVRQIEGQFALIHKQGTTVRMARSIGRPMRYFLAKRTEGPCLVVAERIDEIHAFLQSEGLTGQFHPSYTYEDFFEGFRPAADADSGTVSLELRHGPLRRLALEAKEHPDQAFILVIDELIRTS